MVFKTLDIRQQKTVILDRWKTNEVSPTGAPAYCLESFEAAAQGVEVEPGRLPESRDTKATRVPKTENQGERAAQRENPRDLQRVSF